MKHHGKMKRTNEGQLYRETSFLTKFPCITDPLLPKASPVRGLRSRPGGGGATCCNGGVVRKQSPSRLRRHAPFTQGGLNLLCHPAYVPPVPKASPVRGLRSRPWGGGVTCCDGGVVGKQSPSRLRRHAPFTQGGLNLLCHPA